VYGADETTGRLVSSGIRGIRGSHHIPRGRCDHEMTISSSVDDLPVASGVSGGAVDVESLEARSTIGSGGESLGSFLLGDQTL
jgi:hypothetical protein